MKLQKFYGAKDKGSEEIMKKEHGQVTGIIWRGQDDLQTYQSLKLYAERSGITVPAAAKQMIVKGLKETLINNNKQG